MTTLSDARLGQIEKQLELMELSDDDIAVFTTAYELADEQERTRLWALGDVRILQEIARLKAEQAGAKFDDGSGRPLEPMSDESYADDAEVLDVDLDDGGGAINPLDASDEPHELDGLTVNEVLAWVGDDGERARRALAYERDYETPRTSLISRLEKLADF